MEKVVPRECLREALTAFLQETGESGSAVPLGGFRLPQGDSEMVHRLAVEMYARGLSTRDVEAAFTDENGECLLSRTAVSEVTEVLWEEYEAFQARDLSDIGLLYLFLDGVYEPLRRHGIQRQAVLVAWGITIEGEWCSSLSPCGAARAMRVGGTSFGLWSAAASPRPSR